MSPKDGSRSPRASRSPAAGGADGQLVSRAPVDADRSPYHGMGATQELLISAMGHAAESIVVLDIRGLVLYANQAFERTSGYVAADLIGTDIAAIFAGSGAQAASGAMGRRLRAGLPWSGERQLRRRDGTAFREEVTISPVRDPDGAVVSFVRVGRDVTHVRAIEASLVVSTRERAAFARSLGRLQPRDTPEETGQDITDEVVGLHGISFAALLSFEGDDDARMLALTDRSGPDQTGVLAIGELLPAERAAYLRQRAATGPWAEPWILRPVDGAYGTYVQEHGVRALAYAPVGGPDDPIGLIALGTTDETAAGSIDDHLPAAIEFAAAGGLIGGPLAIRRQSRTSRRRIEQIIAARAFVTVFQPIVDIVTGIAIGFEGLTRFEDGTSPDEVFAEAWSCGIGVELEAATLERTIATSIALPVGPWLGLNVSPAMTLLPDRLTAILAGRTRPIVLEITEHDAVGDYPAVRAAVAELGPDIRMAVDDAGAGAANFTHIVELSPDFVKIDVVLIRGMDKDVTRQALVVGLSYFAHAIDGWVVAEGIETEGERQALIDLGVSLGQGYLFGRPADVEAWAMLGSVA